MTSHREPSLRDTVEVARRALLPAFVAAIAVAAVAYLLTSGRVPVYQAQATVLVTSQDPSQRAFGGTLVTAPVLSVATYRAAVVSEPVLQMALTSVVGSPPAPEAVRGLQARLSVRSEDAPASALLRVLVRATDARLAQTQADAVADALVRWDAERATRALEAIIASLSAQIAAIGEEIAAADPADVVGLERVRAELGLQLSSARALRAGAVGRSEVFERARLPVAPVSPRPVRDAALLGMLGFAATFGLALLRAALDNRLRQPEELAAVTGAPLLAVFPRVASRRALPREPASFLRTGVLFAAADADPKVLLVTSSIGLEGKSSVAIALAGSFARQHYRTVLVDADLRMPVIAREFHIAPTDAESVENALLGRAGGEPTRVVLEQGIGLDILPSFTTPDHPTELLSGAMRGLLQRLAAEYDVIVVDSPPVLPVADALAIAPHTTGVVFVTSLADADRRSVASAIGLLRRLGIRVIGAVATKVDVTRAGPEAQGMGYGYG